MARQRFNLLLFGAVVLGAPVTGVLSVEAATPSFDCKAATTPVETAICGDEALATLDADLGTAFAYASTGRSNLVRQLTPSKAQT